MEFGWFNNMPISENLHFWEVVLNFSSWLYYYCHYYQFINKLLVEIKELRVETHRVQTH